MATMRDIKRRKSSIESTEQITKAMKLVATVKLQKSRTKAENSRLYFNLMYQTIQEMLKKSTGIRLSKERGFEEKGSCRRFFQSRTCRRI